MQRFRRSPSFSRRRGGISLIEVLVILAIIALLVVFFTPAVSSSREAARRSQCVCNLKQIGLALHNYATTWGGFPASSTPFAMLGPSTVSASPQVALLPYLERGEIYQSINFNLPMPASLAPNQGNFTVAATVVSNFLCPSDSMIPPNTRASVNSYRANLGPCVACPDEGHGALRAGEITPLAAFTDGTATTLAFTEKSVGSIRAYDPKRDWLDTMTAARLSADQWVSRCSASIEPGRGKLDFGRNWLIAGGIDTHVFTATAPNSPIPDCGSAAHNHGYGAFAARSQHPGGVNVLTADGMVRFIKSSIPLEVWRGYGTRDGGEVTSYPE